MTDLFKQRIEKAGERAEDFAAFKVCNGSFHIRKHIMHQGINVTFDDIATAEECPIQKAMDEMEKGEPR